MTLRLSLREFLPRDLIRCLNEWAGDERRDGRGTWWRLPLRLLGLLPTFYTPSSCSPGHTGAPKSAGARSFTLAGEVLRRRRVRRGCDARQSTRLMSRWASSSGSPSLRLCLGLCAEGCYNFGTNAGTRGSGIGSVTLLAVSISIPFPFPVPLCGERTRGTSTAQIDRLCGRGGGRRLCLRTGVRC